MPKFFFITPRHPFIVSALMLSSGRVWFPARQPWAPPWEGKMQDSREQGAGGHTSAGMGQDERGGQSGRGGGGGGGREKWWRQWVCVAASPALPTTPSLALSWRPPRCFGRRRPRCDAASRHTKLDWKLLTKMRTVWAQKRVIIIKKKKRYQTKFSDFPFFIIWESESCWFCFALS